MQSSGQNTQSPWVTVPEGRKKASISDQGRTLCLQWNEDPSSRTLFTATHLRHHIYSHTRLSLLASARRTAPVGAERGGQVVTLNYQDVMDSEDAVCTWLETLVRDGLCVLQGCVFVARGLGERVLGCGHGNLSRLPGGSYLCCIIVAIALSL